MAITLYHCTRFFPSWKEGIYIFFNFFQKFPGRGQELIPAFVKKYPKRRTKAPFPQPKPQEHGKKVSHAQISPADSEGGKSPSGDPFQGSQQPDEPGQMPLQRPERIHRRTQQAAGEKAAQGPAQGHFRPQRRHPRRGLLSS